ncbi:cell division protein ZapC [Vibrio sp. JC009]|uniref:cell division protein ZapC n=1 Tax=Vibrio sp. JC009 TaxID=2912314 RepID=UPI0023AE71A6|nr:cell division protein ZapC [Vibrio sp. JC009]WED23167.1 cell division protein ZapC [Vibrio sp. JC009]
MLKPRDTWNWYFDKCESALMLDLGNDMLFRVNLPQKMLVDCAFHYSDFNVDDASAYQIFQEQTEQLDLSEPRQAELVLNCVAAKRFHKPVQPKSWFFDRQGEGYQPQEGDIVHLQNRLSSGYFMVVEVCDNASLCAFIEQDEFSLDGVKSLQFGQPIKVMHDRMECANHVFEEPLVALVG